MSTLAEHQFRCSVCLELFTDPVSTPCGHNFCKTCLETYWDSWDVCRCPLCKEEFYKRPELRINTSFREVVDFFKNKNPKQPAASVVDEAACMAKPGEVPCDVCVGLQFKALKSCLVCMASYCEAHLEPHKTAAALSRHKLIEPVKNLEERMCSTHNKILEWFCRKEEQLVCQFCAETDHSRHQVVTVETEVQLKMSHIKRREREVELMMRDRHKRVEEINRCMERSRDIAQKEMEASVQAFSTLMESLEQTHTTLMAEMEARHDAVQRRKKEEGFNYLRETKTAKAGARLKDAQLKEGMPAHQRFEGFVRELQEEISVLEKKYAELEQLLQVEDHMSLLQDYTKICHPPQSLQNWSAIPVYEVDFLGCIRAALGKAREFVSVEIENQAAAELSKIQRFAEDITVDPDTAGPWLVVSEDGKEVGQSPKKQKVPANPLRFTENLCALATQGFNTGRHYWEVGVREKSNWALGVASSTVNRREYVTPSPERGLWAMGHRDGRQYVVYAKRPVAISLSPRPKTIGVFVDYDEGKVAFYDVDAKAHIFTYNNCCFKDKIYPTFDPALTAERKETAPLRIVTVEISK